MLLSRRLLAQGAHRCSRVGVCSTTASARFPGAAATTMAARRDISSIGILRESYDPWERRTPLCPTHVQQLVQDYEKKVYVQPSSSRVFSDVEYEQAGAIVQEDMSDADLLLGVKRPKHEDSLLANKPYVFFSHVIKGQPENMKLLKTVLDKQIQLVDYECIVEAIPNSKNTRRLVAFGKYAGLAGMINTLYPLGMRIMSKYKVPTPFLYCPTASMHHTLQQAKDNISLVGQKILRDGLPSELNEPLVICVTGKGGNVHNGAMEILKLLPHEMVSVQDLPKLFDENNKKKQQAEKKVYICTPNVEDLYQHKEKSGEAALDFQDFVQHPQNYTCTFKDTIAPYVHALVNCIYWDPRYPRLLTKQDARNLHTSGKDRLLVVSDISCDIHGSIEFLERSTNIAKPFYNYDPYMGRESSDHIIGGKDGGITVMGVDILPTELPRESSTHFGDALLKLFGQTLLLKEEFGKDNQVDMSELSPTWADACVTTNDGQLRPRFQYLDNFMKQVPHYEDREGEYASLVFLHGHLFDSGLINQILDVVEKCHCHLEFDSCHMGTSPSGASAGDNDGAAAVTMSSAVLHITGENPMILEQVEKMIQTLVDVIPKADATMKIVEKGKAIEVAGAKLSQETKAKQQQKQLLQEQQQQQTLSSPSTTATVQDLGLKKIVLLGAGRVSASVVRVLDKQNHEVLVVSDQEEEARTVASLVKHGRHASLDVFANPTGMSPLIQDAHVVISLLPATMHTVVAKECIQHQTDLVTASYESEDMRALNESAKQAGIIIVNEVGLDPGLDHMSAMKIIDDIHSRNGTVTCFKSVCGGLPAPEAANNPLKYKFSWSPKGVISASQNDARYRLDNEILEVDGKNLLSSAAPFMDAWPDLDLECLPNRDSLHYESVYDIQNAPTLFRGTLRYKGFSNQMSVFKTMGLFDSSPIATAANWNEVLDVMAHQNGLERIEDHVLKCSNNDQQKAQEVLDTLSWLGMIHDDGVRNNNPELKDTIVDSFCDVLESKLQFEETERDLVLMHHDIQAAFVDDHDPTVVRKEFHTSSLKVFGDDEMSAMCRTVGTPTAITADLLVSGNLSRDKVGLLLPTQKNLYLPILEAVEKEGIAFHENLMVKEDNQKQGNKATKQQHL